jgi:hypothetical protein
LQKQEFFFDYISNRLVHELDANGIRHTKEHPFIYFVDSRLTHLSFKLFQWCKENFIELYVFFSDSMLVDVFESLKSAWSSEIESWKEETPNRQIEMRELVDILKRAQDEVLTEEEIVDGFRVTGIHPLNAPEDRRPLIQPDPVVHDKRSVVDLIHEKRIQLLNQSMKAIEELRRHLEIGQNEFALNVSTIKKELEFINSSLEQSPAPRFIPRSLPSVQKSSSSSKPLVEKNSDFVDHQSKCRCCFKALKSQRKAIGITEDMRRQFLEITQTEVRLS